MITQEPRVTFAKAENALATYLDIPTLSLASMLTKVDPGLFTLYIQEHLYLLTHRVVTRSISPGTKSVLSEWALTPVAHHAEGPLERGFNAYCGMGTVIYASPAEEVHE
jgi:hypothetical protein